MAIYKELTAKGNLIKDAEKVYPENGGDCYYSMCISVYDGKNKQTGDSKSQLINFYWSGKYADQSFNEQKLKKGNTILVRGEMSVGYYTDKRDGSIVLTVSIRYPNNVEVVKIKDITANDITPTTKIEEPDYSTIHSDDIPF